MSNYQLAVPYHYNNDDTNSMAAEFNILFFQSRNRVEDLIEFIQEYKDKRINISFPEGIHMPTLKSICAVSENIYVRLKATDMMILPDLQEAHMRYFFDASMSVGNYTNLDAFIRLGVSDIYPVDDLCYNINEVAEYCHSKDVRLRLILNAIPSTSFDKGINPRSSIYRPQDIDLLNRYYDTFEFDCGEPYDWAKFGVLYKTWFERKAWHGQISEINEDVHMNFHNDTIYPNLTDYKIVCGRKCNQRIGNYCKKCEQWLEIGEIFEDKRIKFVDK